MTYQPPGEASGPSRAGLSAADREAVARLSTAVSASEVAEALGLQPHREGGFLRETYRSRAVTHTSAGVRPLATAIIYLLTGADPSRFHRLRSDEIWFFHAGCRAELVTLDSEPQASGAAEEGHRLRTHVLGQDRPQAVVPAGLWLGARVAPGEAAGGSREWTLVGCVVTPGFQYEDFEMADREALLRAFPMEAEIIRTLT